MLSITAISPTLEETMKKAYNAINHIHFDGMQYRKDIAHRFFIYLFVVSSSFFLQTTRNSFPS